MKPDIPAATRVLVYERDRHRCRWCGRTNERLDLHHITYRSGGGDHSMGNLITLCRTHHDLVHTDKGVYPPLLSALLENPGLTGIALQRRMRNRNGRSSN